MSLLACYMKEMFLGNVSSTRNPSKGHDVGYQASKKAGLPPAPGLQEHKYGLAADSPGQEHKPE